MRFLPKGKTVVLGLVTSKTGALEHKDDIKRRIDEATKYVDLDQLCLSPQCGFASTQEGNTLAEEEQWAKLRMIVEIADEVWGGPLTAQSSRLRDGDHHLSSNERCDNIAGGISAGSLHHKSRRRT